MPSNYPVEVLDAICAAVFEAAEPPEISSLDPLILQECLTLPIPTALPSSYPPSHWPEPLSRLTLINLSRVSKAFYKATRQYIWRRVEIRLPRTWLALVEEITGGEQIVDEQAAELVEQSLNEAASYVYAATSATKELDRDALFKLRSTIRAQLEKGGTLPPEVLTPPESRNASPMRSRQRSTDAMNARHKSKSPGRWRVIRAVSKATRSVVESVRPDVYVTMPQDARPGRHILHLDFNHFRTIGLRRLIGEGVHSRFVTGERLEIALKEMPNLVTFGATEYMDGALTFPVLTELLFRGRPMRDQQRQPSRGRNPSPDETEFGPNDWHRRKDSKALEALDLCGCVSSVFVKALTDFAVMYLIHPDEPPAETERVRGRGVRFEDEGIYFPHLRRLCLRSVSSISSNILSSFVLAFPSLTHLDLSGTRCTSDLLEGLGESHTIRLTSLNLGRCPRLTGASVKALLIHGQCTHELEQLSLFGDVTCPFPFSEHDLEKFLVQAPCIKGGKLTYLDLSAHPLSVTHLDLMAPQPSLRSLGLSYISELSLPIIANFLLKKAPNVEVVTLVSTSPELSPTSPIRQGTLSLHNYIIRPLCSLPFTLRPTSQFRQAATRLRVIELSPLVLSALGGGAEEWRVIRSKGSRGWYVDTACGWTAEGDGPALFRRALPVDHMLRKGLEALSATGGNISTTIGWHARKMEVLQGHGLLGSEEGLYGAHAFAFAG